MSGKPSGPVTQSPSWWDVLKIGRIHWRVGFVEYVLQDFGYNVGSIDDRFDHMLEEAVRKFQGDYYLRLTSAVDDATWTQMRTLFGVVRRGDFSDLVRAVQYALNEGHGYHLAVDGDFGPLTEQAVRDFQRSQSIDVDGEVGIQTFTYLVIIGR
ncbi:hypothetical protein CDO52_12355 [Nocardiopsis gilva YIM 90087]|uniref:Peptidoglycan binding-like domain-containing protein n=1 Tax=Nocardiopsis gilva YIM 90087 TaxID=1235441 RepID=A0A223S5R3_9ACTN|nr:peptidoglycan-binding protein [Nocardiopsis gilva]ASU83471.1 hypothetical protein CDO52_12355 [Nocardiopsis gilva YIM 90087]